MPKIEIVDIGSRGGPQKCWKELDTNITSFDADKNVEGLPCGIWNEDTELDLYITKHPGCSSVFMPNYDLLKLYHTGGRYELIRVEHIQAWRLDSLVKKADFLKIDVEGAGLQVLQGAEGIMDGVVGIQIEADFIERYKRQFLFSDNRCSAMLYILRKQETPL